MEKKELEKRIKERLARLRRRVLEDIREGRLRQANFKVLCAEVMYRYEKNNKWSTTELEFKELLDQNGLVEGKDYLHNYKVQNEKQNGYYSIDFLFLTTPPTAVELSPSIWHNKMGNCDIKDLRREAWLRKLGFRVLTDRICNRESMYRIIQSLKNSSGKTEDSNTIKNLI